MKRCVLMKKEKIVEIFVDTNTCYSRSQVFAHFCSKFEELSMKGSVEISSMAWFLLCAKMTQSNCKAVDFL